MRFNQFKVNGFGYYQEKALIAFKGNETKYLYLKK